MIQNCTSFSCPVDAHRKAFEKNVKPNKIFRSRHSRQCLTADQKCVGHNVANEHLVLLDFGTTNVWIFGEPFNFIALSTLFQLASCSSYGNVYSHSYHPASFPIIPFILKNKSKVNLVDCLTNARPHSLIFHFSLVVFVSVFRSFPTKRSTLVTRPASLEQVAPILVLL